MKIPSLIKDGSVWLSVFGLAILVGATVFQMLVIVPEFNRDIPNGMISFAASQVEPRYYWTSPIILGSYLLPFLALFFNWKTPRRKWLLISTILFFVVVGVTEFYFIPRLIIMGITNNKPSEDLALLTQTIKEWIFADQLRFWIFIVPSFFFALKALSIPLSTNKSEFSSSSSSNTH